MGVLRFTWNIKFLWINFVALNTNSVDHKINMQGMVLLHEEEDDHNH